MKTSTLFTALLFPLIARADVAERLGDIEKIAKDETVAAYLESHNLEVLSITYDFVAYCGGTPTGYIVSGKTTDGKVCRVFVKVGNCKDDPKKQAVKLLTSDINLKCQ